jgi:hypothetical protein
MDYRLPGIDGVAGDAGRARGCARRRGRLPDAVGEPAEVEALFEAGVGRVPLEDQELDEIVAAIRRAA